MLHNDAFDHSGQGAHYTGSTFQKLLKENKLEQSMSIKVAIYLINYRLWWIFIIILDASGIKKTDSYSI